MRNFRCYSNFRNLYRYRQSVAYQPKISPRLAAMKRGLTNICTKIVAFSFLSSYLCVAIIEA